jgi:hypothetical protein
MPASFESGVEMLVTDEFKTEDPKHNQPPNGKQQYTEQDLRIPKEHAASAQQELPLTPVAIVSSGTEDLSRIARAQEMEINRLQAELKNTRVLQEQIIAAQIKEQAATWQREERSWWNQEAEKLRLELEKNALHSERRNRLVSALEKAQAKHEQLRAACETAQQESLSLRARIQQLEFELTQAVSRAEADAANARKLDDERASALAMLGNQQAEWRVEREKLCQQVEKSQSDNENLQTQIETLRTEREQECQSLKNEAMQHAAELAAERDAAIAQASSIRTEVEQHAAAGTSSQEEKKRLDAAIVAMRTDLETARASSLEAAEQLHKVKQDLYRQQELKETECEEQLRRLTALEGELRSARVELEKQSREHSAHQLASARQFSLLQAHAKELEESNVILAQERARLQTSLAEVVGQRKEWAARIEHLEACLAEERQHLSKANEHRQCIISEREDVNRSNNELGIQVESLRTQLAEERRRSAVLQEQLASTQQDAAQENKRLAGLLDRERTRFEEHNRNHQTRQEAALLEMDQERKTTQSELEQLQKEVLAARLERDESVTRLAHLNQQKTELAVQFSNLTKSYQDAEQTWQAQAARLSQTAQQAQQDLKKCEADLKQQQQREAARSDELIALKNEKEARHQEAVDARKELDNQREVFERERLSMMHELDELRQRLDRATSELKAREITAGPASGNLAGASHLGIERLNEFARKIETLEAQVQSQETSQGQPRRARGFPWSSSIKKVGNPRSGDQQPERNLRALWTEVMSERERVIQRTADAIRIDLEKQLADLQGQLANALDHAGRLEAELQAMRDPMMQPDG